MPIRPPQLVETGQDMAQRTAIPHSHRFLWLLMGGCGPVEKARTYHEGWHGQTCLAVSRHRESPFVPLAGHCYGVFQQPRCHLEYLIRPGVFHPVRGPNRKVVKIKKAVRHSIRPAQIARRIRMLRIATPRTPVPFIRAHIHVRRVVNRP